VLAMVHTSSPHLARLVLAWVLATLAVLGVARTVVALPERCGAPTAATVDGAVADTVTWFVNNQRPDGRWLYRYDGVADEDLGDYNWVRHAGVLLSLEQAARFGTGEVAEAAALSAERGWVAVKREAVTVPTPQGEGRLLATTGGSALAGVAWAERRERTGDPSLDADLAAWVRLVAAQVQRDGSVLNQVDTTTGEGIPGTMGPFSTGQALFLMYRTARLVADHGVGIADDLETPARRIGEYIARYRADIEGFVPDTSDHWSAYGFADLVALPGGRATLTDAELAFARKQIGIAGVQVRYESQRTNTGVDRWLRGRQTLPAGLGTLGESLGGWWTLTTTLPALAPYRDAVESRLACTAGMLVDRQTRGDDAQATPSPQRSRGAWFQFGITQMDDQQHALSALLLARVTGAVPDQGRIDLLPRRTQVPESALVVILAAVALLNPVRLGRRGAGCGVARPAAVSVAVLAGVTAVGGPVLRALDISAATAVVAAGLVAALAGLLGVITAGRDARPGDAGPLEVAMTLIRPEMLLVSLAVGAGGQGWTWITTVAVAVVVGAGVASRWVPPSTPESPRTDVWAWAVRLVAAIAVVAGVALLVEGIYAA
jgi:hypothetical protein